MDLFSNWRFNVFTGVVSSVQIDNEEHLIEYHDDSNMHGIQLHEAPKLDSPSSVSIVEDVTGGAAFVEIPRTQAPSSGEFRVDYDAAGYYGTGRIEFNPSDVGKNVLVSYKGNGYVVKNRYSLGQTVIPASLEVIEDTQLDGNLDIDGNVDVDGNAVIDGTLNAKGDVDLDQDLNVDGMITGDVTGNLTGNLDGGIKETGSGAGTLRFKIIPIGDWNMDLTDSVYLPAPDIDISKIKFQSVEIFGDSPPYSETPMPLNFYDFGVNKGGWWQISATSISLNRVSGGLFDNDAYDSTSYNRGFITIGYID